MKDLREQIYFTDNEIARNKKRIENSQMTEKNQEPEKQIIEVRWLRPGENPDKDKPKYGAGI